jgi:ribosome-binding factor A
MATRRQEKVARVVKEGVSDAIINHLNDPRICGFVSVTRVEMAPNLRSAEVYLSIFGGKEKDQKKTFIAVEHARIKIQSVLSERIRSKFCPILHFHMDEKFKKTLEILNIIDQAVSEHKNEEPLDENEE